MQLREKQKVKRYYGVLEKQFRAYYEMAVRRPGVTGENLLSILETRLDNIVYRLGFASSRKEARQLVRHNHYTIDGNKVNIPSYLVKPGQVIAVTSKSKKSPKFEGITEAGAGKAMPEHLSVDFEKMQGSLLNLPKRATVELPVEERLIVELYSK